MLPESITGDRKPFVIRVGTQNRAYLLSKSGKMRPFPSSLLEGTIPRFKVGKPACLSVHYNEPHATIYHYYEGGPIWTITIPKEIGSPGDVLTIDVEQLTKVEFLQNLPKFVLRNIDKIAWLSDETTTSSFHLEGRRVSIYFEQRPAVQRHSIFYLYGHARTPLRFHLGNVDLRFTSTDCFGQTRLMTIHDDRTLGRWLGVKLGHEFYRVFFASFDGVRLKFVYKSGRTESNVLTIYQKEPSHLYKTILSDEPESNSRSFWDSKAYLIHSVTIRREIERQMVAYGDAYDVGRIGAEIAYAIAKKNFGLDSLVLPDPNWPGKDLFTRDREVVIQARILTQTRQMEPNEVRWVLLRELRKLVWKLRQDFTFNRMARVGLAVLSYVDAANQIKGTVLEIPRSK